MKKIIPAIAVGCVSVLGAGYFLVKDKKTTKNLIERGEELSKKTEEALKQAEEDLKKKFS